MKATAKVTEKDYRLAKYMIHNIEKFAPKGSQTALEIIRTAEKIMVLYSMQTGRIKPAQTIKNPANIIGMHQTNAKLFLDVLRQRHRA